MSLIVEDGTAKSDAESLCSVAFADSYHDSIGNTSWAALTTTQKEQSLRKATFYISGKYGARWAGYRRTDTQALDWPREQVPIKGLQWIEYYDNNIVPKEVQNACASLALRSSSAALLSDEQRKVVREKVDVIEVEYDRNAPLQVAYKEIDMMLSKFLAFGDNAIPMIRV